MTEFDLIINVIPVGWLNTWSL